MKWLVKIIQWFIRLFQRPSTSVNVPEAAVPVEEHSEKSAQEVLFDSIVPGDIVDAWMPLDHERMETVPQSHRHRPYFVVRKRPDCILAYKGSSKLREDKVGRQVLIAKADYHVWKDGYMQLDRLEKIPAYCLIEKLDHLRDETMNEANRRLLILKNIGQRQYVVLFPVVTQFREGDILWWNRRLYYVYAIEDGQLFTFPLRVDWDTFRQGDMYPSMVNMDKVRVFPASIDFTVVYCSSDAVVKMIRSLAGKRKIVKKPREKSLLETDHYYRFGVGQYLVRRWTGEKFLYLFSYDRRDYGIYEEDLFMPDMQVRCLRDARYYDVGELADEDLVGDVLNILIDRFPVEYGWLEELFRKE